MKAEAPAEDKVHEEVNLQHAEKFMQFFCERQAMQTVS